MGRDKARDDKYFNCSQEHEDHYVANLYPNPERVSDFLEAACQLNEIKYSTHMEVYQMIKEKLGYDIPVAYEAKDYI